jgi:hypothetical protein
MRRPSDRSSLRDVTTNDSPFPISMPNSLHSFSHKLVSLLSSTSILPPHTPFTDSLASTASLTLPPPPPPRVMVPRFRPPQGSLAASDSFATPIGNPESALPPFLQLCLSFFHSQLSVADYSPTGTQIHTPTIPTSSSPYSRFPPLFLAPRRPTPLIPRLPSPAHPFRSLPPRDLTRSDTHFRNILFSIYT